jgi:hypothetical protein
VNERVVLDADPTGLGDIREGLEREVTRRWVTTAREVKRAILQDDALSLGDKAPRLAMPTADKAQLFKRWLDERLMSGVAGYDGSWLEPHLDQASKRGVGRVVVGDAGPDDEPRDPQGRWTSGSAAYPLAPRSEWYGEANYEQTGGRMVSMSPDEFLKAARPLDIDETSRDNIDDLKQHILAGKTLDPLALYANGKEDGRHRAVAAKELGIKQVPVINFRPVGAVGDAQQNLDFLVSRAAPSAGACRAASVDSLATICEQTSELAHGAVASGLLQRARPGRIAKLVDQAFGHGLKRTRALAEHAVTQAYSQATLDALEASGVTHVGTVSKRRRVRDFDPDEPRDESGKWTHGAGYEFVSPNVGNIGFSEAKAALASHREATLLEASADVDRAVGAFGVTNAVIGAWADGAEHSTMTVVDHADWDRLRLAAAIKGHLADQKQVLIFKESDPGEQPTAALYSFDAKGDLGQIHQHLLDDGVAFHTLQPTSDGAKVWIASPDRSFETHEAVAKAAARYGGQFDVRQGQAEFLGTSQETGTDREQRDDARRIYADVIERSPVPGSAALWQGLHHRWGQALQELTDALEDDDDVIVEGPDGRLYRIAKRGDEWAVYAADAYDPDEPRDESGRWTVAGAQATIDKLSAKYPEAGSPKVEATTENMGERGSKDFEALAQRHGDNIRVNAGIWNKEFLTKNAADWEGLMNDPSPEGTLTHEFGHLLAGKIENRLGYDKFWGIVYKHLGYDPGSGENLNRKLSSETTSPYGGENIYEFLAEAFVPYELGKTVKFGGTTDNPTTQRAVQVQTGIWKDLIGESRKIRPWTPEEQQQVIELRARIGLAKAQRERAKVETSRARIDRKIAALRGELPQYGVEDWLSDAARKNPQPKHPRSGRFAKAHVVAREMRRSKRTGRFGAQSLDPVEQRKEELTEARFGRVMGRLDVLTQGDDRVCDVCDEISSSGPYTINEARSLIPAHPRCRCLFVAAGTMQDAFDPDQPRDETGRWTLAAMRLSEGLKGEAGYAYHVTNEERLGEIAEAGELSTHEPSAYTDQDVWPDGSEEKRAYFAAHPLTQFAPEEGAPVVIRMPRGALKTERGTGDLYSTKPISTDRLEYLHQSGQWRPLRKSALSDFDPDQPRNEKGEWSSGAEGIVAYHGSPHDFGQFDLAHMGQGEGTQVYGHGLYLAEEPEVAQSYKTHEGGPGGNLYTVRVHASPDEFLDWDKPLSQQSKLVQDYVSGRDLGGTLPPALAHRPTAMHWDPTGSQMMQGFVGMGPKGAARMVAAGLKGVRYLDAGSRPAGKGTHNYVVVDPSILEITHKNGRQLTKAQAQDALDALFDFSPDEPRDPQGRWTALQGSQGHYALVSTAPITATGKAGSAQATELAAAKNRYTRIDMALLDKDPEAKAKMVALFRDPAMFPMIRQNEWTGDTNKDARLIIDRMKSNLTAMFGDIGKSEVQAWRKWYDGAHSLIGDRMKQYEKFGIDRAAMTGVYAAQSPNTEWDVNVHLGDRLLDTVLNHSTHKFDAGMRQAAADQIANTVKGIADKEKKTGKTATGARQNLADMRQLFHEIDGKTLKGLTDLTARAAWVKLYNDAHDTEPLRTVNVDGTFGDIRRKKPTPAMARRGQQGDPMTGAFGTLDRIANAITALESHGDANVLSEAVGDKHKVRSFYNNMLDPGSANDDVTIDTHAGGAAWMYPFGGKDTQVQQMLGGSVTGGRAPPTSAVTGIKGTYPFYADAYREFAHGAGGLTHAREAQSVLWMKKIQMFRDVPDATKAAVWSAWQDYHSGKNSLTKTQQNIIKLAKGEAIS